MEQSGLELVAYDKFSAAVERFNQAIDRAEKNTDKFAKKAAAADQQSRKFGAALTSKAASAARSALAMAGLTSATAMLANALQSAMETAKETQRAMFNLEAAVGAANREFGSAVGTTESWNKRVREVSDSLRVFTDRDVADASARLVDMTKRLGFTEEQMETLLRRTGDLSAGKVDLSSGIERVAAAMRGEAESAEYLGLTLNENAVAAYAQAEGYEKAWAAMSDVEKAQVRYAMFLEQSNELQGRAAESTNTLAGAQGELARLNERNAALLGETLIPLQTKFAEGQKSWLQDILPMLGAVWEADKRFYKALWETGDATQSITGFCAELTHQLALQRGEYERLAEAAGAAASGDAGIWMARQAQAATATAVANEQLSYSAKDVEKGYKDAAKALSGYETAMERADNAIAKLDASFARSSQQALQNYQVAVERATRQHQQNLARAEAQFNRSQAQAAAQFNRQRAQAEADHLREREKMIKDFAKEELALLRKQAAARKALDQKWDDIELRLQKGGDKESLKLAADKRKEEQAELEEAQSSELDELKAQQQEKLSVFEETFRIQQARAQEQFAAQQAQAAEAYAIQRQQMIEAFRQQQADREVDFKRQQQQRAENYKRQRAELVEQRAEEHRELIEHLEEIRKEHADHFAAILAQSEEFANRYNQIMGSLHGPPGLSMPGVHLPEGYQVGGRVPGPLGAPRIVMVHGGERITPPASPVYYQRSQTYNDRRTMNFTASVQTSADAHALVGLVAREMGRRSRLDFDYGG